MRVTVLDRYLARQLGTMLLVTGPALCALVALLQAMRLLPLVAAAITFGEAVMVIALLLVPLAAVALPAAVIISLQLVLARLAGDGELVALRAAGVSTRRLAVAPVAVCLGVALLAGGLTLFAEPAAYHALQRRVGDLLVRSTVGRIRPGTLFEPTPELTILAGGRGARSLSKVFLEDRRRQPSARLFAGRAVVSPVAGRAAARLELREGVISTDTTAGQRVHASFSRLALTLELDEASSQIAEIVPSRFGADPWQLQRSGQSADAEVARAAALLLHRRLALAPGAFGLGLLALVLGLLWPVVRKPWAVTVGAALILAFHILGRAGEALVDANVCGASTGGWLAVILCWIALAGVVMLPRIRQICCKRNHSLPHE